MIATEGGGWLTSRDFAFFIVLAATIFGRYLEFRGGDPRTLTGEPATPAHLRRYVAAALCIGLAVWLLANLIGNNLLYA